MGIVAGLNMSSVARLKKTFEEVPTLYKEVKIALLVEEFTNRHLKPWRN